MGAEANSARGEAFWKTGNSTSTYFNLKIPQKNAYGGLMCFQLQLFASCSSSLTTKHALFAFNCKQPQHFFSFNLLPFAGLIRYASTNQAILIIFSFIQA